MNELISGFLYLIGAVGALALAVIIIPGIIWKKTGAPYVPSNRKEVSRIIALAKIKPGDKAIDLGSGDGRIVIALAKAGAIACGYEISPALVWWSKIKIFLMGYSNKASIRRRDFWEDNLSEYNVVALFGITRIMDKLELKLDSELKPGTR